MKVKKVSVTHSYPTLCDPLHCSSPGSSVHGISLARILEWIAILFSRGSAWPRDWTWVSCTAGRFFTESPGKPILSTLLCELPVQVQCMILDAWNLRGGFRVCIIQTVKSSSWTTTSLHRRFRGFNLGTESKWVCITFWSSTLIHIPALQVPVDNFRV